MEDFIGIYHINQTAVPGNQAYDLMKKLEDKPLKDMLFWQRNHLFLGWTTPIKDRVVPCYDEERQLAIAANLNLRHREKLIEQLEIDTLLMKNISDTQLVLEAYQSWGRKLSNYLEGDFTFIIWDVKNESLFGARDSKGSCPLYYFYSEEQFVFSNHLTPLFALPYIGKELQDRWFEVNMDDSIEMVDDLDKTFTPYKDVMQLPPGYAVSIQNQEMEMDRFCKRRSIFFMN